MKAIRSVLLACSLLFSLAVCSGGVPTMDKASLATLVQELGVLSDHLEEMQENVKVVTDTKENFIGQIDYYKDLISNIKFRKITEGYIPENISEVMAIIQDGIGSTNPRINETIENIMASSPFLEKLDNNELKEVLENSRRKMAFYQAASQEAYNAANTRMVMAQDLAEKSAKVSNEKEARALSLAMQAQNLTALNDLNRQIALSEIRKAREEEEEQQVKERHALFMKVYFNQ